MSSEQVTITYQGKPLNCRAGTSVAVALWEQGIRHLSHSHKYGRPRGLSCARGHCTSCLMRIDGVPNVRSCQTPITAGMVVEVQDSGAIYAPALQKVMSTGSSFFPVGFYYKWFTKPPILSRFFLRRIRPLTGVGRLPVAEANQAAPAGSRTLGNLGTLVVGSGFSGLAAALETAGPVTLIDDHPLPGGQRAAALDFLAESSQVGMQRFRTLARAHQHLTDLRRQLAQRQEVKFLGNTRAVAGYRPDGVVVRDEQGIATAQCGRLVWTAGALDSLGLFPGNDSPGVLGPRAAYRLLLRDGMEVSGRRALIIGSGFDFWLCAAVLAGKGAVVSLVVTESGGLSEVSAAVDLGWQLTTGLRLDNIQSQGQDTLEATFVPRTAGRPGPAHAHLNLKADLAVICRRAKPAYDIPYQMGLDLVARSDLGGYAPRNLEDGRFQGILPGGIPIQVEGEAAGVLPEDLVKAAERVEES